MMIANSTTRQHARRIALFLCCFFLISLVYAGGETAAEAGRERLTVISESNGELKIKVNNASPVTLASIVQQRRSQFGNVSLAVDGDFLIARSGEQPLSIDSPSLPNWRSEAPPGNAIRIESYLTRGGILVESPEGNSGAIEMFLSDGGHVRINAAGRALYELLDDGSYSLRGSTNVTGTSADGLRVVFSDWTPWIFGGPLHEERLPNGATRMARSHPATAIHLIGDLAGEVRLRANELSVSLLPGQERLFHFQNGSDITLKHLPERQRLEWHVTRGIFQFHMEGFSCWKGLAGTGQSGALTWNPGKRIADFSNTGSRSILAQLSSRVTASILPGATLQYSQLQDCGSFVTSVSGGTALLFERDTGEVTPVTTHTVAYSEGFRTETAGASKRWVPVGFSWESDQRVEVRGSAGPVALSAGTERSVRLGSDEVLVGYSKTGDLVFRAVKGNFELKPDFVNQFSVQIPESGAVVLNLYRRRWMLSARAAEDSGAVIRTLASGETYMYLSGEAKVTVNLGQDSFFPDGTAAWIFFEGAGGENDFATGPRPGFIIRPDQFDASRIPQQPVSVIE